MTLAQCGAFLFIQDATLLQRGVEMQKQRRKFERVGGIQRDALE